MKIKKILGLVLATATAVSVMAFSGCELLNSFLGTPEDPTGANALTMEAEYTDIDEVAGAGISNNNSGLSMIYGDGTAAQKEMWSNGYYVGYTHNNQTELTFVFNSSVATTANVVLMLGSELGNVTLTSENFSVLVNGEDQYYGAWSVAGAEMDKATFTTCRLSRPVNLKAGENTIVLKVLDNDLKSGSTGGPHIDCVKVTATDTSASLTWNPHTDNPERRDNEV